MALSALNWRMLAPRNVPVGYNIFNWLELVYQMGQDTTYADGTARVPGTNSAWTWTRDTTLVPGSTTAAIGVPPINALNMAYIVAGDSTARAPTMNTDAWATNAPIVGMNKNSGAYNSWVAANPMTAGQFSGFVRAPTIATFGGSVFVQSLTMWECQEAFLLAWNRSDSQGETIIGGGALIDPLSGAAANAESDGRIYTLVTSSASTFVSNTWLSNGAGSIFNSTLSASDAHAFTFNVGAVATTRSTSKVGNFLALSSAFVAPNGELPNIPFSAYFVTGGQYAGQYRQIGITRNACSGTALEVNGVVKGYPITYTNNAVFTAVLLSY